MEICKWHLCTKPALTTGFCSPQCKSKFHSNNRRQKLKVIASVYKGGTCIACDYTGHLSGYDYHHLDPSKKEFKIGDASTASWKRLLAELDKCVMLCALCHRKHHAGVLDISEYLYKDPTSEEGLKLLEKAGFYPPRQRLPSNTCTKCGAPISRRAKKCSACAAKFSNKIDWPSTSDLKRMLAVSNYSAVGRALGVSDNSVRKRLKTSPDYIKK